MRVEPANGAEGARVQGALGLGERNRSAVIFFFISEGFWGRAEACSLPWAGRHRAGQSGRSWRGGFYIEQEGAARGWWWWEEQPPHNRWQGAGRATLPLPQVGAVREFVHRPPVRLYAGDFNNISSASRLVPPRCPLSAGARCCRRTPKGHSKKGSGVASAPLLHCTPTSAARSKREMRSSVATAFRAASVALGPTGPANLELHR